MFYINIICNDFFTGWTNLKRAKNSGSCKGGKFGLFLHSSSGKASEENNKHGHTKSATDPKEVHRRAQRRPRECVKCERSNHS